MKYFNKFKAVFCLVFAFMFMFGNALFVQVSACTIDFDDTQPLQIASKFGTGSLEFDGFISYKGVIDPYKGNKGKKITGVDAVQLYLSENCAFDGLSFYQLGFNANVSLNGQEIRGYVYGTIEEKSDNFKLTRLITLPFIYRLSEISEKQ